jgi:DUF1009 family protein
VRIGVICGNGRFPLLALESARALRMEAVAIGIREEAPPEIESLAAATHWISLGALGRLIEILRAEGVREVMMCGQVKHAKIFSSIRPDWRMAKLLLSLREKNTDALIGAVAAELRAEGIELVDSTALLKPLLAAAGPLTRRQPSREEERDIAYGRKVANHLAAMDIGQSVAVANGACLAVEAMEGTDAMLRRAASLAEGHELRLVKTSRRRRHLLFDVPVVGPATIDVMRETRTTALAVDAGRTLLLDREELLRRADEAQIAVAGYPPGD